MAPTDVKAVPRLPVVPAPANRTPLDLRKDNPKQEFRASWDPDLLANGQYMDNATWARKLVEPEIGSDRLRKLNQNNILLDLLNVALVTGIGWATTVVSWNLEYTWENLPIRLVNMCFATWSLFAVVHCYHDQICHRRPYGDMGSFLMGLWLSSHVLLSNVADTRWIMRHLIHHRGTYEERDPDLFLHDVDSRLHRWIFLLVGPYRATQRRKWWEKFNDTYVDVDRDFPEQAEKFKMRLKIERIHNRLIVLTYAVLFFWYPVQVLSVIFGGQIFFGVLDTVRYVGEHFESDRRSPLSHSTLYRSGWIHCFLHGCDIADLHTVHHIFPMMPAYNRPAAAKLINPILQRHGAKLWTSIWPLLYAYLIKGQKHGTLYDDPINQKKAN